MTDGRRRTKAVVVTNIPAPYRVELFGHLARLVDLHVLFRCERESNRHWSVDRALPFAATTLTARSRRPGRRADPREGAAIARRITALRPDVVVVGGYDAPLTLAASVAAARRVGATVVLWSGSHEHSLHSRSPALPVLRRAAFRSVDGVIAYSSKSAAFATRCGARDVQVLGNAHRLLPPMAPSPAERGSGTYLYVGHLTERKRFDVVLDWAATTTHPVLAVGAGPLEAQARRLPNVSVTGHLDGPDLQRAFASAAALVFPSSIDTWGLVVNEAMEAGTPVVCDRRSGCVPDLADDGRTAIVRTIDDARDLDAAVQALDGHDAATLTANARRAVREYRGDRCAERLAVMLDRWRPR